ncbi:hypothetical protein PIN31009_01081 [Pandoraea iniqua]|uniref:hypothetical protein n=1 Tax=Pandoraea iniqua TaxID=2508288 RepID=UPI001259BD23|nr:hypothetical protein [Pandoraea iniqua]VVD79789.1 hypothetical protein PIN31009_01081 [Pandoraea iniqua]
MRLPFALAALDWITPCDVQGARHVIDLDGQRGWVCTIDGGYCVAIAIPVPAQHRLSAHATSAATAYDTPPPRWLTRLTLVLAAQPELRNDSVCIARGDVWWVHRFDAGETPASVEAQLRRQILACHLVAPKPDAGLPTPPSPVPHIDARQASQRLRAMRRS